MWVINQTHTLFSPEVSKLWLGSLGVRHELMGMSQGIPEPQRIASHFFQNIPTQLREFAPEEEVCETFNEESLWLPLIRIPPKMNDIS